MDPYSKIPYRCWAVLYPTISLMLPVHTVLLWTVLERHCCGLYLNSTGTYRTGMVLVRIVLVRRVPVRYWSVSHRYGTGMYCTGTVLVRIVPVWY